MTQIYTLVGNTDYEGDTFLGAFASKEQMMAHVEKEIATDSSKFHVMGYDEIRYYVSELGQRVDWIDYIMIARKGN